MGGSLEGNIVPPNALIFKYLHNDHVDDGDNDSLHVAFTCMMFIIRKTTSVFSMLEINSDRWRIIFMQLKAGSGHRGLRSDPPCPSPTPSGCSPPLLPTPPIPAASRETGPCSCLYPRGQRHPARPPHPKSPLPLACQSFHRDLSAGRWLRV